MQLLDRVLLFWVTFVKSPPPSQQVSPGFGLMLSREALSSWFPPTCTIEVERAHAFENPSYILGRSSCSYPHPMLPVQEQTTRHWAAF